MKLTTIRKNEVIGFEVSEKELELLHWAIGEYCAILEYSLKNNIYFHPLNKNKEQLTLSDEQKIKFQDRFDIIIKIESILGLFV
jgi:hypothetical protein